MNSQKLVDIFFKVDKHLCDSLAEKSGGKITTLDLCDRGEKGEPVFIDWQLHRRRRHGFYTWAQLGEVIYPAHYEDGGTLQECEYKDLLEMFAAKYPKRVYSDGLDTEKLQRFFERVDKGLCEMLRIKTNNIICTLHGCERNQQYPSKPPVYADTLLRRCRRSGFYAFMEINFVKDPIELGVSYDEPIYLTDSEYDYVSNLFGEKYRCDPPETIYVY